MTSLQQRNLRLFHVGPCVIAFHKLWLSSSSSLTEKWCSFYNEGKKKKNPRSHHRAGNNASDSTSSYSEPFFILFCVACLNSHWYKNNNTLYLQYITCVSYIQINISVHFIRLCGRCIVVLLYNSFFWCRSLSDPDRLWPSWMPSSFILVSGQAPWPRIGTGATAVFPSLCLAGLPACSLFCMFKPPGEGRGVRLLPKLYVIIQLWRRKTNNKR